MGPDAIAILIGARMVTRSNDTQFPFRQDSDFWYLTGFDHPNAIGVLRTDGGPEYALFVEPRDPDAETWTGYRPGVEGALRDYGADEAFANEELTRRLPDLLASARRIFHVLGRDAALDARILEICEGMRLRSRLGRVPPEAFVDPRTALHEMRLFKEPAEVDAMRRASAISDEAHRAAARLAHPGAFEYELEAALEHGFRSRGARGPAYTTIVGSGANATVLHYVRNDQKLRDGELVLVDAGCELEGYASDVTRTYPIGGRFTGPGRAVYEVVLGRCGPGATLPEIHGLAVRRLVEGMLELGLGSGSVEEIVAGEAYRRFYMHQTSHWLGLDVHDVGAYRPGGAPRRLEPGMVFTVEPGLYVSPALEGEARFRGIGVPIEDDVLGTADGRGVLTGAIPKAPEDLEA